MSKGPYQDYEVGYGKPPRSAQFRKGSSGNPNGRPRKVERAVEISGVTDAAILAVANQKVRVRVGDRTLDMTVREAILQKQAALGLAGNAHAQRDFMRAVGEADRREADRLEQQRQNRQRDFDEALEWQRLRTREWAVAERNGHEPADPWPHPDDFLLDFAKLSWRIRGPIGESEVPWFSYLRAERDRYIIEEALVWFHPGAGEELAARAEFYRLLWLIYEGVLPLRWQMQPAQAEFMIDRLILLPARPVRAMLRESEARARSLEHNQPATDRSCEQKVSALMKPLLRQLGYRSLADFSKTRAGKRT